MFPLFGENPSPNQYEYEPQIWCECGNDKWVPGKIQLNIETRDCPAMIRSCFRCSLCESVRLEYRKN